MVVVAVSCVCKGREGRRDGSGSSVSPAVSPCVVCVAARVCVKCWARTRKGSVCVGMHVGRAKGILYGRGTNKHARDSITHRQANKV